MPYPVIQWTTPVSIIPEQRIGKWHIKKRVCKAKTTLEMAHDDCAVFLRDNTITILRDTEGADTEGVWMSDSPSEYFMAWELSARTKGSRVLIGGLGLGLLVHILALRRDIEAITIIEKSPEVIEMVAPYLPKDISVEVIEGDFLYEIQKLSQQEREFDTVIADIWKQVDGNEELIEDCRWAMDDNYPDAVHLFWSWQDDKDEEDIKHGLAWLHIQEKRKEDSNILTEVV